MAGLPTGTLAVFCLRPGGKELLAASRTVPAIAAAVVTVMLPSHLEQDFACEHRYLLSFSGV